MASPALIVGGVGSAATLTDVARVARGGAVQLDSAVSKRIGKQSDDKAALHHVATTPDEADSAAGATSRQLRDAQARAAVVAHLLPLVNGNSGVRLELVELLVRQLAAGAPSLHVYASSDAAIAGQILAAVAPLSGFQPTGPEEPVLSSGISAAESATLRLGQSSAAGIAALAIADASLLVAAAAPMVTALSAEALQAQVHSARGKDEVILLPSNADCSQTQTCLLRPQPSTVALAYAQHAVV